MDLEYLDCRHAPVEIQDAEKGIVAGYLATYGKVDDRPVFWTEGAFDTAVKAINEGREDRNLMLWHHWAEEPMGRWTEARADETGLWAKGQVALEVDDAVRQFQKVKAKLVTGLSIGFKNTREERDDETGFRRILDAEIPEASLVTFPAMGGARVKSVQSVLSLTTIREWERFLRDVGLSQSAAKALLAKGYAGVSHRDDDEALASEALAALREAGKVLTTT